MIQTKYKTEEETPGWIIFHRRYQCTIPSAYARSVDELERFGTVLTGNYSYDEELANLPTQTTRTIEELAIIFDNGVVPGLHNWEKTYPEIRDLIRTHLDECATPFNDNQLFLSTTGDVDLQQRAADLAVLERFANHLDASCSHKGVPGFSPSNWLTELHSGFLHPSMQPSSEPTGQQTKYSVKGEQSVARISATGKRVRTWQ